MTGGPGTGERRRAPMRTGPAIVLAGAVLLTVGLVGGGAAVGGSAGSSTTEAALTTTSTTAAPRSESATTLPPASTTEATPPPTTEDATAVPMPDPEAAIATSVEQYASAIAAGDVDGLLAMLHPGVLRLYGEEACRTFVETRILPLEGYRLAGEIGEGAPATLRTDEGAIAVAALYVVPVAFRIGEEDFEVDAQFAVEEGSVYWIGRCS